VRERENEGLEIDVETRVEDKERRMVCSHCCASERVRVEARRPLPRLVCDVGPGARVGLAYFL
jgi:hypothetical protein